MTQSQSQIALVLTGGGARGAYQAGVLAEISSWEPFTNRLPFEIYTGVSVGAINVAYLATRVREPRAGENLAGLWSQLTLDQVIQTGLRSFATIGGELARDLLISGFFGRGKANHVLDASPLGKLLAREVSFSSIRKSISAGDISGFAMTATHYGTGRSETFFQSYRPVTSWNYANQTGIPAQLRLAQLYASASIPLLFQPVRLDGADYGDGGIRLDSPLTPAMQLGAKRIFTIGLRGPIGETGDDGGSATLADIFGITLNALFLDALPSAIERHEYFNELARAVGPNAKPFGPHRPPLRDVPLLSIFPSKSLGALALDEFRNFPFVLRHLLSGLGASDLRGADLMSYLAFANEYTGKLVELGREDALKRKKEITEFLSEPQAK